MKSDHVLLLSGPPLAGKGENSVRWSAAFNAPRLSTGDGLRSLRPDKEKPEALVNLEKDVRRWLGDKLTACHAGTFARMDSGQYVDDDIVGQMVYGFLKENRHGMLDAFPRNPIQAVMLDTMLEELGIGRQNSTMLLLEVHPDVLEQRIEDVLASGKRCRPDDTAETIRERIALDAMKRQPVEAIYRASKRLRSIDANGTRDEVFDNICAVAEELGVISLLPPDIPMHAPAASGTHFHVQRKLCAMPA